MKKIVFLLLGTFLLNSCVSQSEQEITYPDFFPEYSWETVPVYAHFSTYYDLSDEQYSIISKYPIVCLEKNIGYLDYGGSDKAVSVIAGKFKELNPEILVLSYISFHTDYGHFYSTGSELGEDAHPEWALRDQDGNLIRSAGTGQYDKANPEARDAWISLVERWSTKDNIDGIFLDSYSSKLSVKVSRYADVMGEGKYEQFAEGSLILRNAVKDRIASKRIVIGNGLGSQNTAVCDDLEWLETVSGAMMDHFAFLNGDTPENIAASIERISRVGKMGKMMVVKTWPTMNHKTPNYKETPQHIKDQNALESITFPLACFLCGAQKYAYICYSGSWAVENGSAIEFPEFNKRLGEPLGDYTRDGFVFTREFKYASVWVDVQTKEAKITWK